MALNKGKQGGGYACKFIITPPGALLCQICQLVARDPQLSVCCGNNFCKSCLEKVTVKERCPTCNDNESFFTTFPNKLSDREIKKLLIWCTNNEKGCGWRDELGNFEDHLILCEYEDVECLRKCGAMVERQKVDDHLNNACPYRQVECEHCHVTGEYHVIVGQHVERCPDVLLSCPNECGLTDIKRSKFKDHLQNCPLQKINCKYHGMGCEAKILIGSQDEHDEVFMKEHFQLMRNELANTKEELQDLKLQVGDKEYYKSWATRHRFLQPAKNEAHEEAQVVIKQEHVEYKKGNAENHTVLLELDTVTKELQKTQNEFAQWKKQNNFLLHQILGTMKWQTRLELLSALINNPDLQVAAPVVIKVEEVAVKKEFKMVYKSPPFFTVPNGNKVCLCILPGGSGNWVSSFSINIMNLDRADTKLNGTFTVSLLNQLDDVEHCCTKLKYESNKESQSSMDGKVC